MEAVPSGDAFVDAPEQCGVLVADEDAASRLLIRTMLEVRGRGRYVIVEVGSAAEAVAAASAVVFDVVVLDGVHAADRLSLAALRGLLPRAAFVVHGGFLGVGGRLAARASGMDVTVSKGAMHDLLAVIEQTVANGHRGLH